MKKMKRYFALLLCLCMAVTLLAPAASAAEGEEPVRILDTQPQEEQSAPQEEEAPSEQEIPTEGETIKIGADAFSSDLNASGETAQPMATSMTWAQLQTALNAGGTVTLSSNVTASSSSTALEVPEDVTVILNLNGHTIDRALSTPTPDGEVLHVLGSLTLRDSVGGGTITGGMNTGDGGGVCLEPGATFAMESGSITGNEAARGGGVYVDPYGDFRISGSPVVTGNSGGNVFLDASKTVQALITITGPLTSAASLGVGVETPVETQDAPVTFTSGLAGNGTLSAFISDDGFLIDWTTDQSEAVLRQNVTTWGQLQELLNAGGNIVLTSDVVAGTMDSYLVVPHDTVVTLDLNGYTIDRHLNKPNDDYVIYVEGDLTIRDSSATDKDNSNGTGKITDGYTLQKDGGGSCVCIYGGTFTLTGGSIEENDGIGVRILWGGSFTMSGGSIAKNVYHGVALEGQSLCTMTGGCISNNGDSGVFVSGGTLIISGGIIEGNAAAYGGGVYINSGTFSMEGGSIESNNATYGGGVCINGGTFSMEGGSIESNIATYGGGVDLISGTFTLSGGCIENNTASTEACGVYVQSYGTFILKSGTVTNNTTEAGKEQSVYLADGALISITSAIKADTQVGVSTQNLPTKDSPVPLTSGLTSKGRISALESDDPNYMIIWDEDHEEAVLVPTEPLEITAQPENCYVSALGDPVAITIEARGEGLSYEWWIKDPGASSFKKSINKTATYTSTVTSTSNGRLLYCIVTDKHGASVQSDTVTMKVRKDLRIVTEPSSAVVDKIGDSVTITVVAEGDGLSYEWWIRNPGAASFTKSTIKKASYTTTVTNASNGRELYCVVSDEYGDSIQTNTVTMSARPVAKIITQPEDCAVDQIGDAVSFSVVAEGEGLSYQWWIKNPGATSFSKSVNKGATYSSTVTKTSNGRELYCIVTDKYGNSDQSNTVKMYAKTPLKIVTQPESIVVEKLGDPVSFTVAAEGDALSYQWWIKNPGATSFSKSAIKTATYSSTVTKASNGRELYCVVTDKYGRTVQSDTVTMRARTVLKIVTQPIDFAADQIGDAVSFTVVAEGDGLSYQWWIKNPGATSFSKSVNKGATYSSEVTKTSNGRELYCIVTDKYGNSVQSKTVKMFVKTPLVIVTQPVDCVVAKIGDTATFSVEAEGDGLQYQWWFKNPGATGLTLSAIKTATYSTKVTEASNGRELHCVVSDKYGNALETRRVIMRTRYELRILTQPDDCVVDAFGETATVTVEAVGEGALSYQWWIKNPGATSFSKSVNKKATYSTVLTQTNNGRQVYCVISDSEGHSVTTDTVTVGVQIRLKITKQPENVVVENQGDVATLQIEAEGENISYEWWYSDKGGEFSLSDETGPTYSVQMDRITNGRQVYCIVTDQNENCIQSDIVTVSIRERIRIVSQPHDYIATDYGERAIFSVTAEGEGLRYRWYVPSASPNRADAEINGLNLTTSSVTPLVTEWSERGSVYCVITDVNGSQVKTDVVTMLVSPSRFSFPGGSYYSILNQLRNHSRGVSASTKAEFNVNGAKVSSANPAPYGLPSSFQEFYQRAYDSLNAQQGQSLNLGLPDNCYLTVERKMGEQVGTLYRFYFNTEFIGRVISVEKVTNAEDPYYDQYAYTLQYWYDYAVDSPNVQTVTVYAETDNQYNLSSYYLIVPDENPDSNDQVLSIKEAQLSGPISFISGASSQFSNNLGYRIYDNNGVSYQISSFAHDFGGADYNMDMMIIYNSSGCIQGFVPIKQTAYETGYVYIDSLEYEVTATAGSNLIKKADATVSAQAKALGYFPTAAGNSTPTVIDLSINPRTWQVAVAKANNGYTPADPAVQGAYIQLPSETTTAYYDVGNIQYYYSQPGNVRVFDLTFDGWYYYEKLKDGSYTLAPVGTEAVNTVKGNANADYVLDGKKYVLTSSTADNIYNMDLGTMTASVATITGYKNILTGLHGGCYPDTDPVYGATYVPYIGRVGGEIAVNERNLTIAIIDEFNISTPANALRYALYKGTSGYYTAEGQYRMKFLGAGVANYLFAAEEVNFDGTVIAGTELYKELKNDGSVCYALTLDTDNYIVAIKSIALNKGTANGTDVDGYIRIDQVAYNFDMTQIWNYVNGKAETIANGDTIYYADVDGDGDIDILWLTHAGAAPVSDPRWTTPGSTGVTPWVWWIH